MPPSWCCTTLRPSAACTWPLATTAPDSGAQTHHSAISTAAAISGMHRWRSVWMQRQLPVRRCAGSYTSRLANVVLVAAARRQGMGAHALCSLGGVLDGGCETRRGAAQRVHGLAVQPRQHFIARAGDVERAIAQDGQGVGMAHQAGTVR